MRIRRRWWSEPLRILLWSPGFYHVGDHFRCLQFAQGLSRRGHEVTYLLGQREFSLRFRTRFDDALQVVHPPYLGELCLAERVWKCQPDTKLPLDILLRCLWVATRRDGYDVIHSFHVGANSLAPFLAADWAGKSRIFIQDWCDLWSGGILRSPGDSVVERFDHWLSTTIETLHMTSASALTVNSSYLAERAVSKFGLRPERILKVVEGADVEIIKPEDKLECRNRLSLPSTSVVLGFSGFFNPDTELLLAMLTSLISLLPHRDVRLLWVGPIDSATSCAIAAAGLQPAIRSVGAVARTAIGSYLGACDVLVLPFSDRPVNMARWPAKLGDYLAAGRPVVSNATGDVGAFFQVHQDIGIATVADPMAFARAVQSVVENQDLQGTYGKAARLVAETALSTPAAVQLLDEFYSSL